LPSRLCYCRLSQPKSCLPPGRSWVRIYLGMSRTGCQQFRHGTALIGADGVWNGQVRPKNGDIGGWEVYERQRLRRRAAAKETTGPNQGLGEDTPRVGPRRAA